MNSADTTACPRCGAEGQRILGRLCAACLLQAGEADLDDSLERYQLLQKIGEGGCGVVYRAEQLEPVRRVVALKIIKLGMDTKQVIARFEAERQTLALMDHPHITKVLDAGVTDAGRPFFVMELVSGEKITDYCDNHRLNTRQRLELFIKVCQAIQHAHQKGIIHRDIKPSNVLVTEIDGEPEPKVIDFGIARLTAGQALNDQTVFTAVNQFIGTAAYMSPEQAGGGGQRIDARSDVYSLGALLYELLAGALPFDQRRLMAASFEEVCQIIREEEAVRPSEKLTRLDGAQLNEVAFYRRQLPGNLIDAIYGDLDWIIMRCLEKECERRYASSEDLASDILRHIRHQPVQASPPSKVYRIRKFCRRHRYALFSLAAVAVFPMLYLLSSLAAPRFQPEGLGAADFKSAANVLATSFRSEISTNWMFDAESTERPAVHVSRIYNKTSFGVSPEVFTAEFLEEVRSTKIFAKGGSRRALLVSASPYDDPLAHEAATKRRFLTGRNDGRLSEDDAPLREIFLSGEITQGNMVYTNGIPTTEFNVRLRVSNGFGELIWSDQVIIFKPFRRT